MGARSGGGGGAAGGMGGVSSRSGALSNKPLKGWNNTFQPKSENTNVLSWMKANGIHVTQDDKDMFGGVKFKDIKNGYDYHRADTIIRDLVYSGAKSLKTKKKK